MGKPSSSQNEETERKAGFGCELAPKIPEGTVLHDLRTKTWILGKPIGSGAFGDVYLACQGDKYTKDSADYVIKLEPHRNGPLFTEMHCLARIGKQEHRLGWKTKPDEAGSVLVPICHGFGSFVYEEIKLRFIVIDKLGTDLDKHFEGGEKPLPLVTALRICVELLDSLEYVHTKGYCHNDIKSQNLLLGPNAATANNVYLVDFGLACKYMDGYGFHKPEEADERRAHDGTLEYTSRDAHIGAHSRRGDLETMGYNLVHWVSGTLPWLKDMDPLAPEGVEEQKKFYMNNRVGFLAKCFSPEEYPAVLSDFLDYVADLQFDSKPDYDFLRSMLNTAIGSLGKGSEGKLLFSKPVVAKKTKKGKKAEEEDKTKVDDELSKGVDDLNMDESSNLGEDSNSMSIRTRKTRSQVEEGTNDTWNWEEVLKKNPDACKAVVDAEEEEERIQKAERQAKEVKKAQMMILENPTLEMCRIMARLKEHEEERRVWFQKDQLPEFNKQRKAEMQARLAAMDLEPVDNTPAMDTVIARREQRLSEGRLSPSKENYDILVDKDEVATRKKASLYYAKLKEWEKRPKKKLLTKKISKKLLVKKGGKKVVRPAAVKPSEDKPAASGVQVKAVTATRASARGKATSILEKSKQLVKKAVQKSKEKIKISPVAVRRLRSRVKPTEKDKEKKDVTEDATAKNTNEDAIANNTIEETTAKDAIEKASAKKVDDEKMEVTAAKSDQQEDNTKDEAMDTSEDTITQPSKSKDTQQNSSEDTEPSKSEDTTKKSDKVDEKVSDKTPVKSQTPVDKITTPEKPVPMEVESKAVESEKSTPIKPSLEETIESYHKNRASLFDSLLSEPSKKKDPKPATKVVEEPSKEPTKTSEQYIAPDVMTQFDLPLLDTSEPLTQVNTGTDPGPAAQPMFSSDDDSDAEDSTAKGFMNFVLSPDEEKEPSSLSFPSLMPSAPSLMSALSPALSGAGSQSPFLSSLARSPAQPPFIPGQSPSHLSLPGLPGQPSLLSPSSLSTPPSVLNQSPRTPILSIVSTQPSTKTLDSSSPTSSEETSLLKPFTTKLVTSQPAVSKSSPRVDKTLSDKKISNAQTFSDISKGTNIAKPIPSPDKLNTDKLKTSLSDEGVKLSKVGQSSQSHSTSPITSKYNKSKASPSLSTSIKLPSTTSLSTKPSTLETIKSISPSIKSLNAKVPDSKTVTKKGVVQPVSALSTCTGTTVSTPSVATTSTTASTSSTPSVGGRQSRPPIPILKISTPLAKAGKRRAFKHYEEQGFQLEDFEEFTDTNDADFVEPKSKGKGRGRPKKQAGQTQAPVGVPKPAPVELPEKKELNACGHFSNKDADDEESGDSKFLSRSLSSIKHRLKSLGKDMSTPIKDSSKKVDSPFTLKIKRDVQGKWKMDSTPKNERLILKISSAKKKTPALKIKPIERNCVSEKPISLKISLKGRSRSPQVVEGTPTSRFVPEGWVSFDQVQTNILPKLKEEAPEETAPKPVVTAETDPKPVVPEPCKAEEEKSCVTKLIDKQDVKVASESKAETDDAKGSSSATTIDTVATKINSTCASTTSVSTSVASVITTSPTTATAVTTITTTSSSVSSGSVTTATATSKTSTTPTFQQHKPKISLRTDLFEVKTENSTPSNNSILRSKLNSGRRNLMDTIDNLKEEKTRHKDNKLVVLNHVTEKLSDPSESWLATASFPSSMQQQQQPEKSATPSESKSPVVSCYCCPTRECRRNGAAFPFTDHTSKDPNLISTLEKSLLSMYADKSSFINPLAQGNNIYGASFNDFDPATSLASLAVLQSSLMGTSSALLAGSGSSVVPGLPVKSGLERMLESEMMKQAKDKQSPPVLPNQGKPAKDQPSLNSQSSSERKELDRQDSLDNIFSVLHNLMGQKQTSPDKSISPSSGVIAANKHTNNLSKLNSTPLTAPPLKLDSSHSLAASLLQPPGSLSSLLDLPLGVPSTPSFVQPQASTAESVSRSSISSSIQSANRDSSNINRLTLAETFTSSLPSSFQNQSDKTKSSVQSITTKTCSNQNLSFVESSLQKTSHLQPEYQGSIFDPLPFEGDSMAAVQPHSQTKINKRKDNNLFQPFSDSNSNNSSVEKNNSLAQSSKTLSTSKPGVEYSDSLAETNRIQGEEVLDTLAILEDLEKSNVLSEMCKSTELQTSTLPLVDGSSEPINSLDSPIDEHDDFDLRTPEKPSEEEEDDIPAHQPVLNSKKAELSTSSLQNHELERLKNELFMSSEPKSKIDSTEKESILSSTPVRVISSLASDTSLESSHTSVKSTVVEPSEPAKSISEDVASALSNIESHNNHSQIPQSKGQLSDTSFPMVTERQAEVSKLSDNQSSLEEPLAKLSQIDHSIDSFLPSQIFESEQSAGLSSLSEPTVHPESVPENFSVKDTHEDKNEPVSNINNQSSEALVDAEPSIAEASADSLVKEISAASVISFPSKDLISSVDTTLSNASQPSIELATSIANISNEGTIEDVTAITSNATEHSTEVSAAGLGLTSDALIKTAACGDNEVREELVLNNTSQASDLVPVTKSTDACANVEPDTSSTSEASSSIVQPTVDINAAPIMEMSHDQNQVLNDFDSFETFAAIQNLLADEDLSNDFVAETMGDTDVMNKTVDIPVSGELLNDEELSNLPDIYLQSEVESRNDTQQVDPSRSVHEDNPDFPEFISNSTDLISKDSTASAPVTANIPTTGAIEENIPERLNAEITNAIIETPVTSHQQSTSANTDKDTLKDYSDDKQEFEEKSMAVSEAETSVDSGMESAEVEFDVDITRNISTVSEKSQASETLCLELSQQSDISLDQTTADHAQNKEEISNPSDIDNKMSNMTASLESCESLTTGEKPNPASTILDDLVSSQDRGTKRKSIDDIENNTHFKKMRLEGSLLEGKSALETSYSEIPEQVQSDIMNFVKSSLDDLSSLEETNSMSESRPNDMLVSSAENKQNSIDEATLNISDLSTLQSSMADLDEKHKVTDKDNIVRVDSDVIFNLKRKEEDVVPTTQSLDDTVIQNIIYDEPIHGKSSDRLDIVNTARGDIEKSNNDNIDTKDDGNEILLRNVEEHQADTVSEPSTLSQELEESVAEVFEEKVEMEEAKALSDNHLEEETAEVLEHKENLAEASSEQSSVHQNKEVEPEVVTSAPTNDSVAIENILPIDNTIPVDDTVLLDETVTLNNTVQVEDDSQKEESTLDPPHMEHVEADIKTLESAAVIESIESESMKDVVADCDETAVECDQATEEFGSIKDAEAECDKAAEIESVESVESESIKDIEAECDQTAEESEYIEAEESESIKETVAKESESIKDAEAEKDIEQVEVESESTEDIEVKSVQAVDESESIKDAEADSNQATGVCDQGAVESVSIEDNKFGCDEAAEVSEDMVSLEQSFPCLKIITLKFISDEDAQNHMKDLFASSPPRKLSVKSDSERPNKSPDKTVDADLEAVNSQVKDTTDITESVNLPEEIDESVESDASKDDVEDKTSPKKKLSKQVKDSASAPKKDVKKTIQKKSDDQSSIQTSFNSAKKTSTGKIRRPPREVFVTNPKVLEKSPFKKPTLSAEEKRDPISAELSNRQILESITTAGRRKRRGSSSSTLSSTSDSVQSRSRTRHESSSSHASDTSTSTRSSRKGSVASMDTATSSNRLAALSPETKKDSPNDKKEELSSLTKSNKKVLKSTKVISKAKKNLFKSTKKLSTNESPIKLVSVQAEKSTKLKSNKDVKKLGKKSLAKKVVKQKEEKPSNSESPLKASKAEDQSSLTKKTSTKSPLTKNKSVAKPVEGKFKSSVGSNIAIKKGLKRKLSTTIEPNIQAKKTRRSSADTKSVSNQDDDDDEIILNPNPAKAGDGDVNDAGDDTDPEGDEGMVHVQVDDEITLCISDSTYNEFQKIESNGPSPVKKAKLKKKLGLKKKILKNVESSDTAASEDSQTIKSTSGKAFKGKEVTDKDPENKKGGTSVPIKKKKKRVIQSAGSDETVEGKIVIKKKKRVIQSADSDQTDDGKDGIKKKKKKIVGTASGMRKGRSGANTRSTKMHL